MTLMTVNMNTTTSNSTEILFECPREEPSFYPSVFGISLVVPPLEAIGTAIALSMIIVLTIVGNILVILSVFTYKPLRIVQNFFIVSLAVADLTVAILVLPLNVAYSLLGRWHFGKHMCKLWLTSDVLCCTASILNLCAIALDRYWAITDPINYAQKRTVERVLFLIMGVWVLSLLISSPPLIGWNDWPDEFTSDTRCQLTTKKGYIIYSSLGSFFIPLVIMTIVYIEIYIATRRRLRERARVSKMNAIALKSTTDHKNGTDNHQFNNKDRDRDSISSDQLHNDQPLSDASGSSREKKKKKKKDKKKMAKDSVKDKKDKHNLTLPLSMEDSVTDNHENNHDNNQNDVDGKQTVIEIVKKEQYKPAPQNKKPGSVYQFIEEKQRISLSKERRAARTLGIIMGAFCISWLPFFLMYVIVPFCPTCCPSEKLVNFITWLGYINSALNPIIYTIFNLEYRRAFKKLLGIKQ